VQEQVDAAFAVLRNDPDEEAKERASKILLEAPDRSHTVVPLLVMELVRVGTSPPWGGSGSRLGGSEANNRAGAPFTELLLRLDPIEAAPVVDALVLLHILRGRSAIRGGNRTSYYGHVVRLGEAASPSLIRMLDSNDADVRRVVMLVFQDLPVWPAGVERRFVRNLAHESELPLYEQFVGILRARGLHEADAIEALKSNISWLRSSEAKWPEGARRAELLETLLPPEPAPK
jgi:hypothetical protein